MNSEDSEGSSHAQCQVHKPSVCTHLHGQYPARVS